MAGDKKLPRALCVELSEAILHANSRHLVRAKMPLLARFRMEIVHGDLSSALRSAGGRVRRN